MMDPRALPHGEFMRIKEAYKNSRDVMRLVRYIELLHELVMPITGLFLQREQEKMGWKQAGLPTKEGAP